ncbi:penicillin acylase family protein [Shouchella clausii]|uniref:penicillin acylase family protein n=1 Tax=Shouchella clausii TaxID=79880 RepID=UPI00280B0910|nr:penicillin acylase family protein [Shouchella clausii]WMM32691.1 penicillin acylase family protein [Shouchella clausii]
MDSIPSTGQAPKKRRVLFISGAAILVILLATLLWAYMQIKKPLPQTTGELVVNGLNASVNVYRDAQGVPHIEAQSDVDLYFSQGYVTAQDRLFQMDLSRRQASGRLAEVMGETFVDSDVFFRTFGLRRAAEASASAYDAETYRYLEAYADGVNAFIEYAQATGTLPLEFRLAGYEPEQWDPIDSLTIGKHMAYDLGGNWQSQAFHYWLSQHVSEEEALDLLPSYPEEGPAVLDLAQTIDMDVETAFANVGSKLPHPFNGSNNWVLSGDRTATGMPLLADDPHLGLGAPSIWYETHLTSPTVNVTGVIFAGVPGIILGSNETIAWGVTNVGPDVQQLYFEQRNPENQNEFLYDGEWYKAEVIAEEIKIAGEEPFYHDVVLTKHGPILSEYAHVEDESEYALSLRWTGHDPTTELKAVLDFNRADNWDQFKEALTHFHAPAQNFVFASTDGTIAYRANGLIPIRANGDDALLPVPGWDPAYEWEGYIPWDELPTIVNPESGIIATANNKIAGDDYPYHISHTWAQPYRQQRIIEVLAAKDNHTVTDMQALQMDVANLQATNMLPLLTEALPAEGLRAIDEEGLDVLAEWNQFDEREEAGPLLFHFWMEEIENLLFAAKIPAEINELFYGRAGVVDELLKRAATGDPGPWVEGAGGFEAVVLQSYQAAIDKAARLQGNKPAKWRWGDFHQVEFSHPMAAITPLNYLFDRAPLPADGSHVTTMAASYNRETGIVNHGAGWRGVFDLSDIDHTYHIVAPGQSGHVTSETYRSQMEAWTEGHYHTTSIHPATYKNNSDKLELRSQ